MDLRTEAARDSSWLGAGLLVCVAICLGLLGTITVDHVKYRVLVDGLPPSAGTLLACLRVVDFLLAGAVDLFHLLKYGISLVLIFVGLKMVWLNRMFEGHFPITVSLGIIVIGSVLMLVGNILSDMIYAAVDPRIRFR